MAMGDGALSFYDRLPDAVFMVDSNHRITYVSAACLSIFGYRPDEMVGRSMLDLVAPVDRDKTLHEARDVMKANERIGFENRYLHKNGEEVHLMWSARWLEAEGLRIGVARDITGLRRIKAPTMRDVPAVAGLAPHEQKVLELLLSDATEKQIAEKLGLALSTTHSYITGIFRKLGVRGRAGLMSLWLKPLRDEPAG
ncbi:MULTISPECIES: PAS domain S-box protein [unclassified Lysobacter]